MKYTCEYCNYGTDNQSAFCHHKNTKKHKSKIQDKKNTNVQNEETSKNQLAKTNIDLTLTSTSTNIEVSETSNTSNSDLEKIYKCSNCSMVFKYDSSYYRHKKSCEPKYNDIKLKNLVMEFKTKLDMLE